MPGWKQIVDEVKETGSVHDQLRRRYLKDLSAATGRNSIYYYSAWLEKGHLARFGLSGFEVNDTDKNAFMATVHGMDRSKGLDLLLHTPGGEIAATESLVEYLRELFGGDIRAVIPQLAMSAGTMIALSCRSIVMGRQSSLGPIDPQIFGMPAHGIVEEFKRAAAEIQADISMVALWQPIISKYHPTLIGECEKAIEWSKEMVHEWLITNMFSGRPDPEDSARRVLDELGSHALTKSHARHIGYRKARELGLEVELLEDNQDIQELVLSVHHAYVQSASELDMVKIVESNAGIAHMIGFKVEGPR